MPRVERVSESFGHIFTANCAYCRTMHVAFTIHNGAEWRSRGIIDVLHYDLFATCGRCGRGVVASFEVRRGTNLANQLREGLNPNYMFPSLNPPMAPPYVPEPVARYFKQGLENVPRNWDAAGAMFRKALEVGLETKFPDLSGPKLTDLIQQAAAQHYLTPELAEWAHEIRLEGNKAVHGDFSKKDAQRLEAFTELVLRYLFTLPGMLDEKKQRLSPQEEGKEEVLTPEFQG